MRPAIWAQVSEAMESDTEVLSYHVREIHCRHISISVLTCTILTVCEVFREKKYDNMLSLYPDNGIMIT
jgi:hypothetical protein